MIPFLVRRALSSVPTLLGISVLTFAILALLTLTLAGSVASGTHRRR